MDAPTDSSLLQDFVLHGNQDAFGAVVHRHLDLVFGTALRQLGDRTVAEEVCQNVFTALARKAAWLADRQQLSGWLYETTLLECRQRWRADLRRKRREQTAIELGTTMDTPNPGRDAMTQMLDEGLQHLRADDREVLLLRYFGRRSLREVGRAIGTTEDTAQKRVARALTQLTRFFQRRGYGIAGGTTAAEVLQAAAMQSPPGLAANISAAAIATTAGASASAFAIAIARLMTLTKTQCMVACAMLATAPAAYQWSHFASESSLLRTLESDIRRATAEIEATLRQQDAVDHRLRFAREGLRQADADAARYRARTSNAGTIATPEIYRWSESSEYVRVPRSLVERLELTGRMVLPGTVTREVRQLPAVNADGSIDPTLSEALGLTGSEIAGTSAALQRAFADCQRQMQANQSYVDSVPDGFSPAANPGRPGRQFRAVLTREFPAEGAAIRERLRAEIQAALGPARSTALLTQLQRLMNEQVNDFGLRGSLDAVAIDQDDITVTRQYRRDGAPDIEGSSSFSGALSLESVPEPLRAWAAIHLKSRTGSTKASSPSTAP